MIKEGAENLLGRAGERSTLARPGGVEKRGAKRKEARKEAKNGAEITGAFFPHGKKIGPEIFPSCKLILPQWHAQ